MKSGAAVRVAGLILSVGLGPGKMAVSVMIVASSEEKEENADPPKSDEW